MTIADRCEEHRCPVYNASPRRAAKRLFGGFLFPGIFPTAGKRGRIGAKLIYDQQEGENQDGNGLYCRRIYPGCRPEQIQRSVNMRSYHCSTRRKNNGGRHPADENGVWRVTKNSGELGAQGAGRAGMALALRPHHYRTKQFPGKLQCSPGNCYLQDKKSDQPFRYLYAPSMAWIRSTIRVL